MGFTRGTRVTRTGIGGSNPEGPQDSTRETKILGDRTRCTNPDEQVEDEDGTKDSQDTDTGTPEKSNAGHVGNEDTLQGNVLYGENLLKIGGTVRQRSKEESDRNLRKPQPFI